LLPVDTNGLIDPEAIKAAITDQTVLISVQHANHEVGTIEPIEKIAAIAHEKGILFHTDAIQTVGVLPVDVKKLDVDFLSLSAQTFYGPQGAAALYIKKGRRIMPLIDGGIQEGGRRAGTENVAAIVGMGTAATLAKSEMESRLNKLLTLRDKLTKTIPAKISYIHLHGHPELRLPNNVNYGFEFIEGESILLFLGMSNIIASSGSACTSKALKASHVLSAMGVSHAIANGTILFSLGIDNTEADIDLLIEKLPPIIDRLRAMSPLYKK
jgi:cysteine desulfurase